MAQCWIGFQKNLHVSYCREFSWNCGCNMKLARKDAPVTQFTQTLNHEIRLLAEHLPDRMAICYLHWGARRLRLIPQVC